jgi:hypothetical protein
LEAVSSYVDLLLEKFKAKGLLIDANLLLLYLVGSYNPALVGDGKYNKLSNYTIEDYHLLLRLKGVFRLAVTTAHVLTEVSNLTGDLPEPIKQRCFAQFYPSLGDMDELAVVSLDIAQRPEFRFLGLTDCALAQVSNQYLIVTDDARFVAKLHESQREALNFNHLREHLFR